MPYPIEKKLVLAISSSALFDMREADAIFQKSGTKAYRDHQKEKAEVPLDRGVAYPFIKRLLNLNILYPTQQPVEIIVLSRNGPDVSERFFASCQHYGLDITRGAFLSGKPPWKYIPSFNASLFLSANKKDVTDAVSAGMPAGFVLPTNAPAEPTSNELRIAFDFDGILASDEAEKVYQGEGLELFHQAEKAKANQPLEPGPLKDLAQKLAYWQRVEERKQSKDSSYEPAIRISIVTARNAPAHSRFLNTLEQWGLSATETFLMGGIEKKRVLEVLKPHLFIDDQESHLTPVSDDVPCVHVPFGVANHKP